MTERARAKKATAKKATAKKARPKKTTARPAARTTAPRTAPAAPAPATPANEARSTAANVCPRCGTERFGPEERIRAEGRRIVRYLVLVCERGHTFAHAVPRPVVTAEVAPR